MTEQLKDLYKRCDVDWKPIEYEGSKPYSYYDNEKLIGYCQVLNDCAIYNLIVDKNYRRRGIASSLLQQAIKDGAKYLSCLKPYINFYVNRGFEVYYKEYSEGFGADLYYMRLKGNNYVN